MLGVKLWKHGIASHVKCHDGSYGHGIIGRDVLENPCSIIRRFVNIASLVAARHTGGCLHM